MEGFREAVDVCGFVDLGFIGLPYTWDNRQQGNANIKVRRDRGFATGSFLDRYRSVRVWHIQTAESDHCALVLECLKGGHRRRRGRRFFRYENMWRRDPTYMTLESRWSCLGAPNNLNSLAENLDHISASLSDWEQSSFGSVRKELIRLRKELERERRSTIRGLPDVEDI